MSIDNRGKPFSSMFSVYAMNAQVIPNGVNTLINMGTGVIFDILGEVNALAYTFTPNRAGYYYFYATSAIQNLGIGNTSELYIYLNALIVGYDNHISDAISSMQMQTSTFRHVTPNDTVSVYIGHNQAPNRNLLNGMVFSRFTGFRVG